MDPKRILECQQYQEEIKGEERICRLCFKRCANFQTVHDDIKEVLNVLLPKIDLAAIREPVMCTLCAEILFICFDFKATCLNTYDYLYQFVDRKDDVKLNLKDIYMTKNKENKRVPEDEEICGFCVSPVTSCSAIFPDVGERHFMLKTILEQCLPEMDLRIIKEPVICTPCHASIEKHFRFVTSVLIVEEKIKKYRETLKISNESQMDLGRIFQFISEVDDSGGDIIKVEEMLCDHNKGVDVEHKYNTSMDIDDLKYNNEQNFTPKNMLECDIETNEIGKSKVNEVFCRENSMKFKVEDSIEVKDEKLLLHEELEIKTDELDLNRCEEGTIATQQTVIVRLNEKLEYSLLSKIDGYLLKPHCEHKDYSDETMHKCDTCAFHTKYKKCLKSHFLKHKDNSEVTMYECDSCVYQTKYKKSLKSHLLKHKDISEVAMFKCDLCVYETKYKTTLKRHFLRHKSPSDVTMYKCDSCVYQTKYKESLKSHLLKHKDISEVTIYKCDSCMYETKYKSILKMHFLRHKNPSEVTMYKCDSCLYETKHKIALKKHFLTHKSPSEVIMYKCDSCLYETKYKVSLKKHFLPHKSSSEATMYTCDSCVYQTKYKKCLKSHFLKHKDNSEVRMYECDSCVYQTKYKKSLKSHLLKHKDISEVAMFKCDLCVYETKYKTTLKRHFLRHKSPSDVTMYKCDSCLYETKYKMNLKKHFLTHKSPSKVIMYKCDSCVFQTKYKKSLKSHLLKHKDI